MATPRKGSRNICVDGTNYRWYSKHQPARIAIAICHSELSGQHLAVTFDEDRVVTPGVIAFIVRRALGGGWRPEEPRLPMFLLDGDEAVAGTEFEIDHPPDCNWNH